ncbi:hypothetical protein [Burkholderia sp. Bp8986]|uniref:hypothetical protein n=1 Tax=Burkholderia sp. Bp8986 TaxID=2184550 RepID=UPI000F5B22D3|nr:hypothetical protein [Burkholderia sp. Bp8986]
MNFDSIRKIQIADLDGEFAGSSNGIGALTYKGKQYIFSIVDPADGTYRFSRAGKVTFIDAICDFIERFLDDENYAFWPRSQQLETHVARLTEREVWRQKLLASVLRTHLLEKQPQRGMSGTQFSLSELSDLLSGGVE